MKKTKHIILVSIDTFRADCIGSSPTSGDYSSKYNVETKVKTDGLDQILKSAIYFNNCYSAAPYTSASHGAYFTGVWPIKNGIYEFFNRKLMSPTIFQYAKEKGFETIFQTDFPIILGDALGITKGIDNYFIEDQDSAFKTLQRKVSRKTLSFFHFGSVHYPYGFHNLKFGGTDYKNKIKFLENKLKITKKDIEKLRDVLDETFRDKKDTELLYRYKYIVEKLYRQKRFNELFELYLEGINYFMKNRFDRFIRKVKKFVDKNDAILIIFSDHGEEWDAVSEGHHNSISENVLKVPLMIYGKGVNPQIVNSLTRTIDVAPTIINLIGGDKNILKNMDGNVLNIFDKKIGGVRSKYAFSQVYQSLATKKNIAKYQQSVLKDIQMKPLKTYLAAEVIHTNKGELARYYRKDGTLTGEEAVGIKGKLVSGHLKKKLRTLLKKYNENINSGNEKVESLEQKIRNELNSLGYNI